MKPRATRGLSVRARLTLWNVGVLAITLLLLGGVVGFTTARSLTLSIDRDLRSRMHFHQLVHTQIRERGLAPSSSFGIGAERTKPLPFPGSSLSEPLQSRIFTARGEPLLPVSSLPAWDAGGLQMALRGQESFGFVKINGQRARLLSAPLAYGGKVEGAAQAVYLLTDVDRAMGNVNRVLLLLVPVALLASTAGGHFLTGRMLRPVRQVTQAASQIGADDLSGRLTVSGQDEFSALARTFNEMLARLEASWEQQRRFTADASHELRTPLTVIKAHSSLALSGSGLNLSQRRAWEATDRAAHLMAVIVEDLLLLSRSDAGQLAPHKVSVRLSEVVQRAAQTVFTAGASRATFTNGVPGTLTVCADVNLLMRLLINLLRNADQHTPIGSIEVTARQAHDRVTITVRDTGAGIAPEHLPRLTERFYRVDDARARQDGGTGLGLAICQSIARAHGGDLRVESQPGVGTAVSFSLSAADAGAVRYDKIDAAGKA